MVKGSIRIRKLRISDSTFSTPKMNNVHVIAGPGNNNNDNDNNNDNKNNMIEVWGLLATR